MVSTEKSQKVIFGRGAKVFLKAPSAENFLQVTIHLWFSSLKDESKLLPFEKKMINKVPEF